MNKNIAAIILVVLAGLAIWWGWGKLEPYLNTGGDVPAEGMPGTMGEPGVPGEPTPAPQP